MNALRIICLVLAVCVLGIVGWRGETGRGPWSSARPDETAALGDVSLPVSPPPDSAPPPVAGTSPAPMPVSAPAAAVLAASPAVAAPEASAPTVAAAITPPVPTTPEPTPSATLHRDRLVDVPEFAAFIDRLRLEFPHDYIAIVTNLDQGGEGADAAIWTALRNLEQSRGILAAQAAPAALDRFFEARSAVLDDLAPLDARRCADFLYGVTDAALADFTAAHRTLVATLADRTLEAIADGRDRPMERSTPTGADLDALAAGLAARGLSPEEIGFLMDGTAPDPPPADPRVCAVGRTYLDVLRGLPADARQRIYGLAAELLSRS